MSWSIYVTGTKKGARRMVEEAKAYGSDSSQLDAAKQFILSEIDALPDDVGVRVEAGGHHDSGNRNLSIKVERTTLYLE